LAQGIDENDSVELHPMEVNSQGTLVLQFFLGQGFDAEHQLLHTHIALI